MGDLDSEGDLSGSVASSFQWKPKILKPEYLLASWIEPKSLQKRLTLAIVLPTATKAGMFSCCVDLSSRKVFQMSVIWPRPLANVELMHKTWLPSTRPNRIQAYHPKI